MPTAPALLAAFSRVIRATNYSGFANVNFKLRDATPVILDINPRVGSDLADLPAADSGRLLASYARHAGCG